MAFTFRGEYDNTTAYVVNDTVTYQWLFYACTANSTWNIPTNISFWAFIETPEVKVEDLPEKTENIVADDELLLAVDSEDLNKTKRIKAIKFKWDKWDQGIQGIPWEMQWADIGLHGIVNPWTDLLSQWTPWSTFNVVTFIYYIDGVRKTFAWVTNQDPWFLAWEEFAYIGIDASGLVIKKNTWFMPSEIQSWIIEIWIVRSFAGWPWSNLDIIDDSPYFLNDITKRKYLRSKFEGTSYDKTAGKIEASSTPRQLNNLAGYYIDGNEELKEITAWTDINWTELYFNWTDYTLVPASPLNVNNTQYNPWSWLSVIPTWRFVAHTILHSVRTNAYFLIYGKKAYDTLSEALSAWEDLWPLQNDLADVNAVAIIAIKQWETTIREIKDIRHKNGADNLPTLTEWSQNISNTFDGWVREKLDFSYVEDSGTIYLELEQDGGWDLVAQIDWSSYDINCTTAGGTGGKARVALTPWTDTIIQENWIYIELVSWVATLKSSTTIPSWQKAIIGKCNLLSVARFISDWNQPATSQEYNNWASIDGQGLFMRTAERIRKEWPKYISGVDPSIAITTNPASIDTVNLSVTAGIVYQFNRQSFDELLAPNKYVVINHPTTPFLEVDSLDDINIDANWNTLRSNNDRYGLNIIWIQNSWPVWDRLWVLLPAGKYSSDLDALNDVSNFAVTSVSQNLWEIWFRIGRVVLKYSTTNGGTITNLVWGNNIQDERWFPLWQGWQGAWSGSASAFSDWTFEVFNSSDPTKKAKLNVSWITTWTVRTLTVQDKDWTIATIEDILSWEFNLTAWESLSKWDFYRYWIASLWENTSKMYKTTTDTLEKSTARWIVLEDFILDEVFNWATDWVVDWYSWLLSLEAYVGSFNIANSVAQDLYLNPNDVPWQTFTLNEDIELTSIAFSRFSGWTSYTFTITVYDDVWTLLATSNPYTASSQWVYTLTFPTQVLLDAWSYEFRITWPNVWSLVWAISTDTYAGWNRTINWVDTTWDLEFWINWIPKITWSIDSPLYIQDDGSLWLSAWTNEASAWVIVSDTQIRITNKITSVLSDSATAGSVSLWNAEWYITVKVNWVDKKIPYYGV